MQTIKVKCKSAGLLTLDQMTIIQGNLKELSKEDYENFKKIIIKHGYSDPINIWVDEDKNKILSGTTRFLTIRTMRDKEGFIVPPLPVSYVEADTLKEAKEKLLAFASQFGKVTKQGTYEYISQSEIDYRELAGYKLPGFKLASFELEYFTEKKEREPVEKPKKSTVEFIECPNCHKEFRL